MKKIGLIVKEVSQEKIQSSIKTSESFFIVKYSGLSSPEITALRQSLKNSHADLFVVKNTVARRALKGAGFDSIIKSIEGPCGFIFTNKEPVATSKILYDFSKGHEKLKLEAGFLEDKILTENDIKALAKLPSREVLRAQVVGALNAPISGLVVVLSQALKKFVICLDQIRQKKTS